MNAQAWTDFFKEAGLGPDVAAAYGNIFFTNKIDRSHIPYLNREVLGEMNISVLGHILMILKHARLVSDRVKSSTSAACLSATSSESEDQISPTVVTRQEIEGSTSESNTKPEALQCQLDSSGGSQALRHSSFTNNHGGEMEDSELAEAPVGKDSKKESSEEAVKCADEVSQLEKSELSSQSVPAEKISTEKPSDSPGVDGVGEKDDAPEQNSLLPTPPMPHNWFDPSRKHCETGVPADDDTAANHEGQDESNPDDAERKQENTSNILAYSQENEPERPPILPEKICSPLLPTPVMPENWLDPSRSSNDSGFPTFSGTPFFQTECVGDIPASSYLPEDNMNSNMNMNLYDHFIPSSDTTNTDPLCPQASLFPNDNMQSQNSSTFDPYAEYNDQTMQDRNFKAKSNPAWNKQVRQAQPYYRPQPQPAYGATNCKEVIRRWTNLRDCFAKSKKDEKAAKQSGAEAIKRKEYVFSDQLQFLNKIYTENNTVDSLDPETEPGTPDEDREPEGSEATTPISANVNPPYSLTGRRKHKKLDEVEMKVFSKLWNLKCPAVRCSSFRV